MLRALGETVIEGVATTIPAHLHILSHPDFAAARHSTKWVEDVAGLADLKVEPPAPAGDPEDATVARSVQAEVNGKRFDVKLYLPEGFGDVGGAPVGAKVAPARRPGANKSRSHAHGAVSGGSGRIAVPMQGTIVKVLVTQGDKVEAGQTVCVLEAMKMENAIVADKSGEVAEVKVKAGDTVGTGDVVVVIS